MSVSTYAERPVVADSRLTHCNIVETCGESVQKAANDRTRLSIQSVNATSNL
jgi:hypothetical protein